MDALRRHGLFGLAGACGVAWAALNASGDPWALVPGLIGLVLVAAGVLVHHLRWGTVVTAALALVCSAYLLSIKVEGATKSACDLDTTISCGVVNQSSYSEVAGVPITLFGLAFYAGLMVAAFLARAREDGGRFDQLNAWFGAVTVAYSLYLAWASAQLGAVCLVCLTMYACNALLLTAGVVGTRRAGLRMTSDLGTLLTDRATSALVVTFGLVLLVGVPECTKDKGGDLVVDRQAPDAGRKLAAMYKAATPVALHGEEPLLGRPDAPYTVVEFADFGCPHCARAKKELTDLVAARPDVKVLFKVFPLDGACNPALGPSGQDPSPRCDASRAAVCAQRQRAFWPYAGQLFTNQGYFAPDQLRFMAEEADLDLTAFDACMDDPTVEARVLEDAKAGEAAGIRGTPALFVTGLMSDGAPVEVTRGVPAILQLVEAHADGLVLPAP